MNPFTDLIDLAAERVGGVVLAANDEFFAPKGNLLRAGEAVFIEDRYTDRGKWMDGWETRRRREPGHDWCLIRVGLPGIVRGVVVDTRHFKGNFPEACSIDACALDEESRASTRTRTADGRRPHVPGRRSSARRREVTRLLGPATRWTEILPRSPLHGDTRNLLAIEDPRRYTHLRFNIYPDGGVARLRIHGEVVPGWKHLGVPPGELDLAAAANGGLVVLSSDMFFGSRQNLIMPGDARNMGDGWETRRRRGPGHDWVIIRLAGRGIVRTAEVDTRHFKGNAPGSCSIEACRVDAPSLDELAASHARWQMVLPPTPLRPHKRHRFEKEIQATSSVTHARFNIFPDGGVGRLRLFGMLG